MRFTQSLLDEIRQRLPVSQVVSRRVKLKRKGREYVGLSPFKPEKTPSFTVNDLKGFYHCFATGEHGDIFSFVTKTEGLSFAEAVEQLAAQAGVPLPVVQPEMQKQQDERERLYLAMEAAAKFFTDNLYHSFGREALAYLNKRNVSDRLKEKFRLGYAPNDRSALKIHLQKQGFSLQELVSAGLLIGGEDIAVPYDRFRNRIMFPITDLKGRVIAFGGRAMEADQQAKYLNSPETPLFHKGHILFNAAHARQSAYDTGRMIVVEGYMDVIALAGAGFVNAVAPLGTALTSHQLQLLWRMVDEPTLCFDGDSAGQKAAFRSVEMALPLLTPGKSVCFAFLPGGLDPDDLLQQQGTEAMATVLGATKPLVDVLWQREWESGHWDTPERRAALQKQLKSLVTQISDESVRFHYDLEMKKKLSDLWRSQNGRLNGSFQGSGSYNGSLNRSSGRSSGQGPGTAVNSRYNNKFTGRRSSGYGGVQAGQDMSSASLLKSSLVMSEHNALNPREALIIKTLLNHLWLVDEFAEEISLIGFGSKILEDLRNVILQTYSMQNSLDREGFRTHLNHTGYKKSLDLIERAITHKCDLFVLPDASRDHVEAGWKHLLAMHRKQLELKQDLQAAERAYYDEASEENFERLRSLRLELLSTAEIAQEASC